MFSFFKKKVLWLIIPLVCGSIISSIVVSEFRGSVGNIKFHSSNLNRTRGGEDSFILAGANSGEETKKLTPTNLVTRLAKDPNSIPLLMWGFGIQVAKSIFEGKLSVTKHYKTIEHFQRYLKASESEVKSSIKQKRSSKKRVKRDWVSDNESYLTKLKNVVVGKINAFSIEDYYDSSKGYIFNPKKGNLAPKSLPFIGFLMGVFIQKYRPGHFVHHILPYASSFRRETKEIYEKKFKNVTLPDKPDLYFPDFEPEKVEEFKKKINLWAGGSDNWMDMFGPDKNKNKEKLKEITTIQWFSNTNTPQKNLALRYAVSKSSTATDSTEGAAKNSWGSFLWNSFTSLVNPHLKKLGVTVDSGSACDNNGETIASLSKLSETLKQDPLKLFCISDKEGKKSIEFLVHSAGNKNGDKSTSGQIIFWRDRLGFNLLFPSKLEQSKSASAEKVNQNLMESKVKLVKEFKDYVEKNFPYLLLKYYLFIKENNGLCCCKEIIQSLINLWELSEKLTEFGDNSKDWNIRSRNNSLLSFVDYSQESNYLAKLGTIAPNFPKFLDKRKGAYEEWIKAINSNVKSYLSKIEKYFNSSSQDRGSELKDVVKRGGNGKQQEKYWTFEAGRTNKQECMKKDLAEFLLEKISSFDLLKKGLFMDISFEKVSETIEKNTSTELHSLEQDLSSKYQNFFNFSEGAADGRQIRDAQPQSKNLTQLLLEAIKEELVGNKITTISDTLLYKLSENNEQQRNSNDNFEKIKNLLTLQNLSNQPLKNGNTLEKAQMRLFLTSLYLMENSLANYRELLKGIVKNELFGAYTFTISWNKFCPQEETKNPIDPNKNSTGGRSQNNFWTPIKASSGSGPEPGSAGRANGEWNSSNLDSRLCIKTGDRYSFAEIKKISETSGREIDTSQEKIELMGYKGSISRSSQLQLPGNLYEEILKFLIKEGHINWGNIKTQVDSIKTNNQFSKFISYLSKTTSSIGKAFELPDYKKLRENTEDAKKAESLEWFGLEEKKRLLKKFIQKYLFQDGNPAVGVPASTADNQAQNTKNKPNFNGLMYDLERTSEDKKQYIFETKDENESNSAAFLIQYTVEDLKDETSFAEFIKKYLTPSSLIKDIVKKANDLGLQTKAINHYLMRGNYPGGKVYNLTTNDYHLKEQFTSIII